MYPKGNVDLLVNDDNTSVYYFKHKNKISQLNPSLKSVRIRKGKCPRIARRLKRVKGR